VLPIVLAWFVSPILTGTGAALIFFICRTLVLRRQNSAKLAYWVLPPMTLLTFFINIYFVFTKGAKKSFQKEGGDEWTDSKAGWVALCCGAGAAFVATVVGIPLMKIRVAKLMARDRANEEARAEAALNVKDVELTPQQHPTHHEDGTPYHRPPLTKWESMKSMYTKTKSIAMRGLDYDVHGASKSDEIVAAIHENAEKFDPETERIFSYLQVRETHSFLLLLSFYSL
jgi:solute carrier family 20 (sodium-dependent phosphate transporter)